MTRRKRDRIRRWTYIFDAVVPGIFFYAAISSGKSTTDLLFISIANCFYVHLHSTRMFASTNHLFPLAILLTSKPFIQQAGLFFHRESFRCVFRGFLHATRCICMGTQSSKYHIDQKRWDMKWFTWFSLWLIFKPSSFWFIHFQIYTCTCNIHACITKLVVGFQYDQTVKIWIIWFNKSWYGESASIVSMYTLIYG